MFPHERSLVSRFQARPFALLGVNSDPEVETLRRLQDDGTVTWRNWWDGRRPTGGQLFERWEIEAWPTIYILDHKGVIRHKFLGAPSQKQLDRILTDLVKEAENADHTS